ncbi:MAG: hypothetical protein RL021_874 [Bacteroidota bacterium]|jgi:alkane 1-monooxygenase
MVRNLSYFLSLIPGLLTISGNYFGGQWVWLNTLFSLVFLPLVEWFVPEDRTSASDDKTAILPDLLLVLHFIFQPLALIALSLSVVEHRIVGWQLLGAALSTGIHSGTSSIVVAHELIHRKSSVWQFMGRVLLWSAGNIAFYVEHLKIHHKWVGTDRDPSSARIGENVYGFFVRSTIGQIRSAWKLEAQRMRSAGKSALSIGNELMVGAIVLAAVLTVAFSLGGLLLISAFLFQWLVANFLYGYTNYIEHYGLTRDVSERVLAHNSWQSDKFTSRFILIDLSRHADHHYYASKPYHTLDSHSESPVLPGGYASALYLALIPPLWFKRVHPLLASRTR